MPYRTAFWILVLLTVVSAIMQMIGYNFLWVLVVLLIIDSIGFAAIVEIERKKSLKEIETGNIITQKIENLEKICQDVLERVNRSTGLAGVEDKLKQHREERDNMMDKISRKTLELEQKINKFGASLAEHMEDVGNRLGKLELPDEKPKDQSFSIGEIVYVDDKENV